MFVSAIKKAQGAVEGVAIEAAIGLTTILLACGAFLFAAGAGALWLSTIMPIYFALLITAAAIGLIAVLIFLVGHNAQNGKADDEEEKENKSADSPLGALIQNLASVGAPLDVVASGLFARQFQKAPISTVAATAAVGALLGMMTDANNDDGHA